MSTNKYKQEYLQQLEENYDDWFFRIVLNKGKKNIPLEWEEIRELLNVDYSIEYLRKLAAGIVMYSDYLKQKAGILQADSAVDEYIADEVSELKQRFLDIEKEKMRMSDQKREMQKHKREWARAEHILERIQTSIEKVNERHPITINEKPTLKGKREGVLMISDWHKGLNTHNHWNQMNDKIFMERLEELINKTIQYSKDQKVGTLNCFLLGDLIHGIIHVTTRIEATEGVIDQTTLVAEAIAGMIEKLAKKFKKVRVFTARGNHERVSPNMKESLAKESFFEIIPWYLKGRFGKNKRVEIIDNIIDDEIIVTDILGYKIFGVHGHSEKKGSVAEDLTMMIGEKPDYILLGHYHKNDEDESGAVEIIGNPSFSGMDSFAKRHRLYSKPAQKFIIFDEHEGRLCTYNIQLQSRHRERSS